MPASSHFKMCCFSSSFYLCNLAVWVLVPVITETCTGRPTLKCPYVTFPVTYEFQPRSQYYLNCFPCNLRMGGLWKSLAHHREANYDHTQREHKGAELPSFIWQLNKLLCSLCVISLTTLAISCSLTEARQKVIVATVSASNCVNISIQ